MTPHKINFYLRLLSQGASHQHLFSHVTALTEIQQVFREIAPLHLACHCALSGLSNGKLIIFAHNSAIAAKLRQMVPSLLLKFQANGYEVTAIRIAVQANSSAHENDMPGAKRSIGREGRESLRQLAAKLPESPLKTSVESLLCNACTGNVP
jgi:hypothetical protein